MIHFGFQSWAKLATTAKAFVALLAQDVSPLSRGQRARGIAFSGALALPCQAPDQSYALKFLWISAAAFLILAVPGTAIPIAGALSFSIASHCIGIVLDGNYARYADRLNPFTARSGFHTLTILFISVVYLTTTVFYLLFVGGIALISLSALIVRALTAPGRQAIAFTSSRGKLFEVLLFAALGTAFCGRIGVHQNLHSGVIPTGVRAPRGFFAASIIPHMALGCAP